MPPNVGDIILVDMSASIATAVVWHLQRATKTFASVHGPVPIIEGAIRSCGPVWQLSDGRHSIETDLTDVARRQLAQCEGVRGREEEGRHVTVLKYRLVRKAKHRYVLVVEDIKKGGNSSFKQATQPQGVHADPIVLHTMRMHQQYLDKVVLADQAEILPSFDSIAAGPSAKYPVLVRVGGGGPAIDELQFFKETTLEHQFLDFPKGEMQRLLKAPFVGVEREPGSRSKDEPALPQATDTLPNPSLGTMEPEVHKSLGLLMDECKPPLQPHPPIPSDTQPDLLGPNPSSMQVNGPASEPRADNAIPVVDSQTQPMADVICAKPPELSRMNIGVGVYQSEGVEKLRQERENKRRACISPDQSQDLLDVLKPKDEPRSLQASQESQQRVAKKAISSAASNVAGKLDQDKRSTQCKTTEHGQHPDNGKGQETKAAEPTVKSTQEGAVARGAAKVERGSEREGGHENDEGLERKRKKVGSEAKGDEAKRQQLKVSEFERYLKWRKERLATSGCAIPGEDLNEMFIEKRELVQFTLHQKSPNVSLPNIEFKKKKTLD
jgi:hypothetical protein